MLIKLYELYRGWGGERLEKILLLMSKFVVVFILIIVVV